MQIKFAIFLQSYHLHLSHCIAGECKEGWMLAVTLYMQPSRAALPLQHYLARAAYAVRQGRLHANGLQGLHSHYAIIAMIAL